MINETPFKHIWHCKAGWKDGDDVYPIGFYFVDETQGLNGPYDTLNQARKALEEYIKHI